MSDGTATSPADYTAGSGTLNFAAGVTSQTITVPIINDALDEADETYTVRSEERRVGTNAKASGLRTIVDNDATPSLSIDDVSVNENAGTATFTVSLSAASGEAVSVIYSMSDGTATSPADYTAGSGTLNFAAGVTSQTITVPIINDALDEADETYTV